MAAGEDEAQPVVRDRAHLCCSLLRCHGREIRLDLRLAPEQLGLLDEPTFSPQPVDRAVAGRRDDPCAGVVGQAAVRPYLEGDDERVLNGLFGEVEVTEEADERRDRPAGFLAEQAVDDLVRDAVAGRRRGLGDGQRVAAVAAGACATATP
ncbi:MAG TPA: hypothetical protein VGC90_08890 [Candidatus Limnocylindrales bacterium]